MRTVGFIGGYDNLDLLLYIAKILTLAKKKVILVDTTLLQKARYVVPTISPAKSYITQFEGFDVAVGFNSQSEIKNYLGVGDKPLEYDYALVDGFEIERAYKNCFVTAFDVYSVKRGIEIIREFKKPVKLTKVLFSKNFLKEENEYLDYLSLGCKVAWDKEIMNFPIELGNYGVSIENQIVSSIRMKRLSDDYKNSMVYLIAMIFDEDVSEGLVRKIIRSL